MQIWLQRLCYPLKMSLPYTEKMCFLVEGKEEEIWESCWLMPAIKAKMDSLSYIDRSKLTTMPIYFDLSEIKIFEY